MNGAFALFTANTGNFLVGRPFVRAAEKCAFTVAGERLEAASASLDELAV